MSKITIIILTFNEEHNVPSIIENVRQVSADVYVVDSYSKDATVQLLEERNVTFVQHPFENYSVQRRWAQDNCPFDNEWVVHLDADERLTDEWIQWYQTEFPKLKEQYDGFYFSRRSIFLGRWLRYGGQYPNFHCRLFRKSKGYCEHKEYDQHYIVPDGKTYTTKPGVDILNDICESLDEFILSHNRWASKEAKDHFQELSTDNTLKPSLLGNPAQRRRWLKNNIFAKTPLFARGILFFIYRYIFRFGFLDGKPGLIFYFLQSGWFRFLVDAKIYEIQQNMNKESRQ